MHLMGLEDFELDFEPDIILLDGQEYDLSLQIDKPKDVFALASISREEIFPLFCFSPLTVAKAFAPSSVTVLCFSNKVRASKFYVSLSPL